MSLKFNDFITNDINEKTVIIGLLPKNTTNRQKEYNRTVDELINDYKTYREAVVKFINYKYNKLMPKKVDAEKITSNEDKLNKYYEMVRLGNPKTTYYERMGIDMDMYEITHYYNLTIEEINKNINNLLTKFSSVGVVLKKEDFKVNPFAYLYMSYIFEDKDSKKTGDDINKKYEQIYWKASNVFDYITIVFRTLIIKNKKKFDKYTKSRYFSLLKENKFTTYYDLVKAIKNIYQTENESTIVTEFDYINDVINNKVDSEYYTKDNPNRTNDINSLLINSNVMNSELEFNKTLAILKDFRNNMEEYRHYLDLEELVQYFQKKYKGTVDDNGKKQNNKQMTKINFNELWKIKYKNYYNTLDELVFNIHSNENELLTKQSIILTKICKELNDNDSIYFDSAVENNLKINTSVGSILEIITAFPYFTRKIIKDIFQYDTATKEQDTDIILDKINKLTFNPYRKLIDTIPAFVEKNIPQVLMNSYRFENINVTIESFDLNSINLNINKINKILLIDYVKNFKLKDDEIRFLKQAYVLKQKEEI